MTEAAATVTKNAEATAELKDEYNKITFNVNKVDAGNGAEIEGARMAVIDAETGKEVDNWTSKKGEIHDFGPALKAGRSYILRETNAPRGYAFTTDIEFSVSETGGITANIKPTTDEDGNEVYLVEDKPIQATLQLVDDRNDNPLEKGRLVLLDKNGNKVTEWVSDGGTYSFGNLLQAGEEYTIHEEKTPDGYESAPDIKLTVAEDGTVTVEGQNEEGNVVVRNTKKEVTVAGPGTPGDNDTASETSTTPTTTDEDKDSDKNKNGSKPHHSNNDRSTGTGDGTPIGTYILLFMASLTAIAGIAVNRARRRQSR